MKLIVALRLFSKLHARPGVEGLNSEGVSRGRLVDVGVDRLYPALKNIISFHTKAGSLPPFRSGEILREDEGGTLVVDRVVDCPLFWCEIESDLPISYWQSRHEVEAVLPKAELDEFAASIRSKAGAGYVEACEEFARSLPIHVAPIRYRPPRTTTAEAA